MKRRRVHRLVMLASAVLALTGGCAREPAPTPAERLQAVGEQAMSLLVQGREERADGRYAEALALADSLVDMVPDLPEAHALRGFILMHLYQLEAADEAFERTVALDPYHRSGWYQRGHVAFEKGEYREAIRRYALQRETVLSSPEHLRAFYRKMDEIVLPQTWLQVGRAYELLHRPDSASWAYEEVLALDTTHAQAHAWLADLHDEAGSAKEALFHAQQAWRYGEENTEFAYRLGMLLFGNGDFQEALHFLEYAANARPYDAGARYNIGRVLRALGREEEAGSYLEATEALQYLDQEIEQARAAGCSLSGRPCSLAGACCLAGPCRALGRTTTGACRSPGRLPGRCCPEACGRGSIGRNSVLGATCT